MRYTAVEEGELTVERTAVVADDVDRSRVRFMQVGAACCTPCPLRVVVLCPCCKCGWFDCVVWVGVAAVCQPVCDACSHTQSAAQKVPRLSLSSVIHRRQVSCLCAMFLRCRSRRAALGQP
jgi:hypothetical protein